MQDSICLEKTIYGFQMFFAALIFKLFIVLEINPEYSNSYLPTFPN